MFNNKILIMEKLIVIKGEPDAGKSTAMKYDDYAALIDFVRKVIADI